MKKENADNLYEDRKHWVFLQKYKTLILSTKIENAEYFYKNRKHWDNQISK